MTSSAELVFDDLEVPAENVLGKEGRGFYQAMQHKFVDMCLKIENARHLVYKAALRFGHGKRDHKAAALAKYYAANIANEVAYDAMQVFGGYGYFQEYKVERYYRDARILSIYEGTAEIQKNIIGAALFPNLGI